MDLAEATRITKLGIFQRGMFIQQYAGVEFALTHLLAMASMHPLYASAGDLPFTQKSKLRRFREILGMGGPIGAHSYQLLEMHSAFEQLEERRRFVAHGIMVGLLTDGREMIVFRLYEHVDGVPNSSEYSISLDEMRDFNKTILPLVLGFTSLVDQIGIQMRAVTD